MLYNRAMAVPDIKMVCFDLNRTLIVENTWEDLNLAMGVTPEEDAKFLKWYEDGEISYEEGQRFLEKIYLSRGKATRGAMLNAVSGYRYAEGAREIVEYLKKKGYQICLLSGSIDLVAEKVADELGIELWAAHNRFVFDEDDNFRKIMCEGDDADFKLEVLTKFVTRAGWELKNCVCVGDGYNDRKIFEATGYGITTKGTKIEDKAWKVVPNLLSLEEIL